MYELKLAREGPFKMAPPSGAYFRVSVKMYVER